MERPHPIEAQIAAARCVDHIESWRARLAEGAAGHAPDGERDRGVQRLIDCAVFLRMCEARRIEPQGVLLEVALRPHPAMRFSEHVAQARLRYGSSLLRFPHPSDRAAWDDGVLSTFLSSLYFSKEGCDWNAVPADIMGRLYERFSAIGTRKASGIYYTPPVIIEDIVRRTVGTLLEPKEQVSPLRVVDPACGCGSFLLLTYQFLLDSHERRAGSTAARLRILRESIFGVDLDEHAVELTKLSLLLVALEGGSTDGSIAAAIPGTSALDANIQCGNALIGTDYRAENVSRAELDEIKPFDWTSRFAAVFGDGGFDVVIGNPPYVSYGGRQAVSLPPSQARYFADHYECAGWATAHSLFMERAAKLLAKRLVSFIVPDQVGHLEGYRSLRGVLLRRGGLREVKYWGEGVFEGVTTPSMTFVLDVQAPANGVTCIRNADGSEQTGLVRGDAPWTLAGSKSLLDKLGARSMSIRPFLADCGVRTTHAGMQVVALDEARGAFIPTLEGKQMGRYWCARPEVAVRLDAGAVFKSSEEKYRRARFLIRQTAAYPIVGPHENALHFRNSLHALYEPDGDLDVRYLVALLNSKVIRFAYVRMVREAKQRTFPQVKLTPLGKLPVRAIDFGDRGEREVHDRIVTRVDSLLAVWRKLLDEANAVEREAGMRRAQALDASLDEEIFELYGLNGRDIEEIEQVLRGLPLPPLPGAAALRPARGVAPVPAPCPQ
jgi:hypothetical protein